MAGRSLGSGLKGLSSPGKAVRKGSASMTIEAAAPKTFTDKNLDGRSMPGAGSGEQTIAPNAKPGAKVMPIPNAPKQVSRGAGSTKPNASGLMRT